MESMRTAIKLSLIDIKSLFTYQNYRLFLMLNSKLNSDNVVLRSPVLVVRTNVKPDKDLTFPDLPHDKPLKSVL